MTANQLDDKRVFVGIHAQNCLYVRFSCISMAILINKYLRKVKVCLSCETCKYCQWSIGLDPYIHNNSHKSYLPYTQSPDMHNQAYTKGWLWSSVHHNSKSHWMHTQGRPSYGKISIKRKHREKNVKTTSSQGPCGVMRYLKYSMYGGVL